TPAPARQHLGGSAETKIRSDRRWLAVDPGRKQRLDERGIVAHAMHQSARGDLRMLRKVREFDHGMEAAIGGLDHALPMRERLALDQRRNLSDERGLRQWIVIARDPLVSAESSAERGPEFQLDRAERDELAVSGAVDMIAGGAA